MNQELTVRVMPFGRSSVLGVAVAVVLGMMAVVVAVDVAVVVVVGNQVADPCSGIPQEKVWFTRGGK